MSDVNVDLVAELKSVFSELEALEAVYKRSKISFFHPIGQQPHFFAASLANVRLVLGSNRSGKSVTGACEASAHAMGYRPWLPLDHPDRIVRLPSGDPIPVPNVGRVLGENFPVSVEQTLWPKFKEWMPESEIKSVKRGQRGYVEKIELNNGSVIHFMAYKQDVEVFEGTNGHWAWFDEPPPRSIYIAINRGLIDFGGHCWLTMTPLVQPWTHDDIFSKANDPDGKVKVFSFSIWDNCIDNGGYLTRSAIEDFLSKLRPEERESREHGRYAHLTGLIFKEWRPEAPYWIDPFDIPASWPRVCVIDPHPRKPVAVTWIAYSPSGIKYVYRDMWREDLVTIREVSDAIKEAEGWGTGLQEPVAMRIIDDSSQQTERTSGESVFLRFAKEGIRCRKAHKRNYWGGIDAIHDDLRIDSEWHAPGLVIFNTCAEVKNNFLRFCYADWKNSRQEDEKGPRQEVRKTDDDFIDCIRYAYMMSLDHKMLTGMVRTTPYLQDTQQDGLRTTINIPGAHAGMRRKERQKWRTQRSSGLTRDSLWSGTTNKY